MHKLEYQALRKITGAYHGSSHGDLAYIAAIEPLERKLDDHSVSWFARSVRTGDQHIRQFLEAPPAPLCSRWEHGKDLYSRTPHEDLDGPICAAARLRTADPDQLSYGDRDDLEPLPGVLTDMSIMDAREENSKSSGPWLATISRLMDEGWRARYSDGSGAEGHAASAAHMMSRRAEPERTTHAYLGPITTSGDAELQGLLLGLQLTKDTDQVLLVSDSQAGLASIHTLAQGTQPPCDKPKAKGQGLNDRAYYDVYV